VLPALQARRVGGHVATARVCATAERPSTLSLELLGDIRSRAAAAASMRIAAFGARVPGFVAAIPSIIGHREPPVHSTAAQMACRVQRVRREARSSPHAVSAMMHGARYA
jgi:hypothetical protein